MPQDHQDLISQLAMLRFKAQVSYEKHQHTKRAFDLTRAFLERGYRCVYEEGRGELHTDYDENHLRAYVMTWRQPNPWYGTSVQYCALDFDWQNPQAILWVTRKLLELKSRLDDDCEMMLSARYRQVLGVALGAGFGIDSVVLLGDPQSSLDRLCERYDPPMTLGHLNLRIKPLSTRREIEHLISLKRDYFTAHPEFCWFGAREEHLNQHRIELEDVVTHTQRAQRAARQRPISAPVSVERSINSQESKDQGGGSQVWVIYQGHQFLGNFSYTAHNASAHWGHSAGLEIMLHPHIQKRGVVKTVYRVMLTSMIERGVEVYKGGTAQPAVMGLGRLMERPLFCWVLRKRVAFAPQHFSPYLPEVPTRP